VNLTRRLISEHLLEGRPAVGEEIVLRVDQALTEDATALSAYQQFEVLDQGLAPGVEAFSFIDHSIWETTPSVADNHLYLRSIASHYSIAYSPAGCGICHLVFLERFARPGAVLAGADSHTPTAGALGTLGIGVGGLELAVALASRRLAMRMPAVVGVELCGALRPWVGAKDVILELLRRFTVRGGVGKVFEYFGSGVATLSVAQRATIANVGAELGLTSSIFPADEQARRYLAAQGREEDFQLLQASSDADYDERVVVDLDQLEPLVALPSSPDNVQPVQEVAGTPLEQVVVGSCTNGTYEDVALVARVLRGRQAADDLTLAVTPGSKQIYHALAASGDLAELIGAGARILEPCCGPCIGMDVRPSPGAASLRTYNRNFPGRSGTRNDRVYLCSPAVAAASALAGEIVDPRLLGEPPEGVPPRRYPQLPGIVYPSPQTTREPIVYGANYSPVPAVEPLPGVLRGRVLIVVGDEITTDDIIPAEPAIAAGADVQALGELIFSGLDPAFSSRARDWGGGFVVGGDNYGQGSSREQAVLGPLVLGLRAIVARSYARIHHTNLVNFGILPLVFADPAAYDTVEQGDEWELRGLRAAIGDGRPVMIFDRTGDRHIEATYCLTPRQIGILLAGGLLNTTRR